MYLTVKFSGNETLLTKEVDMRDLEFEEQQLADIETIVNEGNLILFTDTIETLKGFFPNTEIKNTDE